MFEPVELFETLMRVAKSVGDIDSAQLYPPSDIDNRNYISISGDRKGGGRFELNFTAHVPVEAPDA